MPVPPPVVAFTDVIGMVMDRGGCGDAGDASTRMGRFCPPGDDAPDGSASTVRCWDAVGFCTGEWGDWGVWWLSLSESEFSAGSAGSCSGSSSSEGSWGTLKVFLEVLCDGGSGC